MLVVAVLCWRSMVVGAGVSRLDLMWINTMKGKASHVPEEGAMQYSSLQPGTDSTMLSAIAVLLLSTGTARG